MSLSVKSRPFCKGGLEFQAEGWELKGLSGEWAVFSKEQGKEEENLLF
jgi:hypothetical protein